MACLSSASTSTGFEDKLVQVTLDVEADEKCIKLTTELLQYAKDQFISKKEEIQQNLAAKGLTELDVLWPGAGYNSIACGGNWEVLCLLEREGMVRVRDVMGASGGAASAILALADPLSSSKTLITNYLVYDRWVATTWGSMVTQGFKSTCLWTEIYRHVIRDDAAFERVNKRGYVAFTESKELRAMAKRMLSKSLGFAPTPVNMKNWVLTNFATREQCAQAYEASGEASLTGAFWGLQINGLESKIPTACDGGGVTYWPDGRRTPLLYYATFYGHGTQTSHKSIDFLYRQGVDETILALTSKELRSPKNEKGEGGMAIILDPEELMALREGTPPFDPSWQTSSIRPVGHFLDVETGMESFVGEAS